MNRWNGWQDLVVPLFPGRYKNFCKLQKGSAVNLRKAADIIEWVRALGTVDFCLCAGARNSPFITLLDDNKELLQKQGQLFHFFEERCASFFALGRAQKTQRPVAIITTSGTAATEMISAAVEAFYTGTPLIFITADRPSAYRQTGAPQSINQIGIFSHYTLPTVDLENDLEALNQLKAWNQTIPIHLNVCFAEPLLSGPLPRLKENPTSPLPPPRPVLRTPKEDLSKKVLPAASNAEDTLQGFLNTCKYPLFIVSGLSQKDQDFVAQSLSPVEGAWWIEGLSGLRGDSRLEKRRIQSGERLLQLALEQKQFDGVLRIGSVPTTRIWRDLEERFLVPVLSFSDGHWTGLARTSVLRPLKDLSLACEYYRQKPSSLEELFQTDLELKRRMDGLVEKFPRSELSFVKTLSQMIGSNPIYLGNSLPVREWDGVANAIKPSMIAGNRGANGIDGQLSTFLGWAPEEEHSWALLGDLTTLYDLTAPWIHQQQPHQKWTVVIMNNLGGQIFKPLFGRDAFINAHALCFEGWAQMWNLSYQQSSDLLGDRQRLNQKLPQILELRPCATQTQGLREEIENLWKTVSL